VEYRGLNVAKGFKNPDFNDRATASAAAKLALIERHKSAPKPDAEELAAANARRLAREEAVKAKREQAKADKEAAARAAEEAARAAEEAAAEQARLAAEAAKAAQPKLPTQAELKAARDARYAARKARR
jgi:hypothetical protein